MGPDIWTEGNGSPCFIERKTLLKNAASKVKLPFGISIRIGRWNIPGSPMVVLVGYKGMFEELNRIYGDMWNVYGVDSLHAYGDYDESCAFAVASALGGRCARVASESQIEWCCCTFRRMDQLVWVSCILNT